MTRHIPALLAGLALGLATALLMPCGPAPRGAAFLGLGVGADRPVASAGQPEASAVDGPSSNQATQPRSAPSGTGAASPSSPSVTARGPEMAQEPTDRAASSVGTVILGGVASWYATGRPGIAAAGPSLREALGPGWRGMRITVTGHGGSVRIVAADTMAADRLIDLPPGAWRAVCGKPLSAGVCRVVVTLGGPAPTPPVTSTVP